MKTNAKTSENKPALRFAAGALAMIIAVSMLSGCQKKIDDEPDPSVTQATTTPSTQPPEAEAGVRVVLGGGATGGGGGGVFF